MSNSFQFVAPQVTITAVATIIDIFVIILSIMSMILTAHTLVKSYKLGKVNLQKTHKLVYSHKKSLNLKCLQRHHSVIP